MKNFFSNPYSPCLPYLPNLDSHREFVHFAALDDVEALDLFMRDPGHYNGEELAEERKKALASALSIACFANHIQTVQHIMDEEGEHFSSEEIEAFFTVASSQGNLSCALLLIDRRGQRLEKWGSDWFRYAAMANRSNILRYFNYVPMEGKELDHLLKEIILRDLFDVMDAFMSLNVSVSLELVKLALDHDRILMVTVIDRAYWIQKRFLRVPLEPSFPYSGKWLSKRYWMVLKLVLRFLSKLRRKHRLGQASKYKKTLRYWQSKIKD